MAAITDSQGSTVLQQQLSLAYETHELSAVLKVLEAHKEEIADLEEAKCQFAINFLGYIESDDPARAIRENAKLFKNAATAEEAIKRHFEQRDEAQDLRAQVADIRAGGRTFSAEQLEFVPRERDEKDDASPPSPALRSSLSVTDRIRAGQWGIKRD